MAPNRPRPGMALLLAAARRRAGAIGAGLAALIAVDLLQLFMPRFIKFAVDDLTLGSATAESLLRQAAMLLLLAGGIAVLRMVWRPLLMGFARTVEADIRESLFTHLQDMHIGYLADNPPGELMARATGDLNNIRMASGMGLVASIDGAVMAVCALGFMIHISPLLTLIAVLPMPGIVILARLQSRRLHKGYADMQRSFGKLTELVREGLSGIRMVKAYGLADREQARLDARGRAHLEINMALARVLGLFFPVMVFFTNLSLAVVLGFGGPLTVFGNISPGDFVAFSAYLGMLTWPMMALGWVVSLMQRAQASMARVEEVLSAEPLSVDPPRPAAPPPTRGLGLAVRGLSFTYPGASAPALDDVSLEIPPGRAAALVGPVASGKSTLLNLATRLHEPPPGAVFLGGVDVRDLTQGDVRARVTQVAQEAFIFSASLGANLCLGRPRADQAAQWAALEAAELAEEVRALPQGLDTRLGERGYTLSGGQRQRLALARALLLDPPVLLMDDPLSAVDNDTEARILANLGLLRKERATLVVTHRLASASFADHIYVLDRGRVVEQGAHQYLLSAGGLYQVLFAEQSLLARLEP